MNTRFACAFSASILLVVSAARLYAADAGVERTRRQLHDDLAKLEKVYQSKVKDAKLRTVKELKVLLRGMMLRQDLEGANEVNQMIKEIEESIAVPPKPTPPGTAASDPPKSGPTETASGGFDALFGGKDLFKDAAEFKIEQSQWRPIQNGQLLAEGCVAKIVDVPKELKGREFFFRLGPDNKAVCVKRGTLYVMISDFWANYPLTRKANFKREKGKDFTLTNDYGQPEERVYRLYSKEFEVGDEIPFRFNHMFIPVK